MIEQFVKTVCAFVKAHRGEWAGPAAELLLLFKPYAHAEQIDTNMKPWPQSPQPLSRLLKKYKQSLAAAGIVFTTKRTGLRRTITLALAPPVAAQSADWLDDPAYQVTRRERARVKIARRERLQLKADAIEEEQRKLRMGCVVSTPGSEHRFSGW